MHSFTLTSLLAASAMLVAGQGNNPAPAPTQGGLTPECQRFYRVESGNFCQQIVDQFGTFSLSDFYSWNPAVGDNCGGLQAGYYVCVGVSGTPTARPSTSTGATTGAPAPTGPQPQQPNIVRGCQRYHEVVSGDSCTAIVNRYRTFSLAQFLSWNPDAGGNACSGLWLGYYVCIGVAGTPTTPMTSTSTRPTGVATPSPIQSGTASNCNQFAQANAGGTCPVFAARAGIPISSLYAWNPVLGNVGQNCQSNFWAGYYYCVGVA